jgi:thiamine pyrophosphate-dependent acetolactate synthase large subunit-like protein
MGLAASVGIGVAQWTRRTTVVVDGDGSLLMNPVGLITAGALPDLPLVHIVLDDGCYASTGGQSVPSRRTDLCALATACGYERVSSTSDPDSFTGMVRAEIARCSSPVLLIARLTAPDAPVPRRIDVHLPAHARRFSLHLSSVSRVQAAPRG